MRILGVAFGGLFAFASGGLVLPVHAEEDDTAGVEQPAPEPTAEAPKAEEPKDEPGDGEGEPAAAAEGETEPVAAPSPVAEPAGADPAGADPAPLSQPPAEPPAPVEEPPPAPSPAAAATLNAGELEAFSLEQLLEVEIGVASRKGRTIRNSPGVVTLITRDEILSSGARDLTDVLLRVPGFAFGVDVAGVVGVGFRGNWGHEGKVLMLLDGLELNENLYSTLQFGNHLPVDQIERIEIIRGPGSAIYGGYAELAVINIITRGSSMNGGDVAVSYGQSSQTFTRRNLSISYGRKMGDLEVTVGGLVGQGIRSNRQYQDFYGDRFEMGNYSTTDPAYFNIGAKWKGLSARFVYDDYRIGSYDGYDALYTKNFRTDFVSYLGDLRYDLKIGDAITVTPRIQYKNQTPWRTLDKDPDGPFYDKSAQRVTGGVATSWDASRDLNVLGGVEVYQDSARLNDLELVGYQGGFGPDGDVSVDYQNVAAYSQVLWDTPVVGIAVGARYENHSQFGSSFVPRAGLTKVIDRLHLKLLYSNAFRAPGIENINLNPDIEPERTTVWEAEAGYKLNERVFASLNVFDITIKDPIVYYYDPDSDEELYFNFEQTGSRGAETEVRYQEAGRYASFAMSFYDAANKNKVPLYAVEGHPEALLGMPRLKLTARGGAPVRDGLTLNGGVTVLGPRWGYLQGDGAGGSTLDESDPVLLVDAYLLQKDFLVKKFDLGVGIHNLFDADYRLIQPYDGAKAPLPTDPREVFVRASYAF